MDSTAVVVSAEAVNRLFVLALAAPLCIFAYLRMLPRLSPPFVGLASAALLLQGLAAGIALGILPVQDEIYWLWDPNREYNIPSTLASTQLALVGSLALGAAWLLRARLPRRSPYLAAVGFIFLFLALDEYFVLHEELPNWKRYYAALGAFLVLAALHEARRSPRITRMWYFCFAVGLAVAGSGAVFIEFIPASCGDFGILRLDGCLDLALWEESLEFLGIWLALLAMMGIFTDALPTPRPRLRHSAYFAPVLWMLLLYVNSLLPSLELQLQAQPASIEFERRVGLRGYTLDTSKDAVVHARVFTSSRRGQYQGLGYTLSLVAADSGETVASQSAPALAHKRFWMLRPGTSPIFPQSLSLGLPPTARTKGAYWIVLTVWRDEGDARVPQQALASDHELLNGTGIVLAALGGTSEPSPDAPPPPQ